MRKTNYNSKIRKSSTKEVKSTHFQIPKVKDLIQDKKIKINEGNGEILEGIGMLVNAFSQGIEKLTTSMVASMVEAIDNSNAKVIEALNIINTNMIGILASGNVNFKRIDNSKNNNIINTNIKEDSKINQNIFESRGNMNMGFKENNINNNKIEATNSINNMNLSPSDIVEENNNINLNELSHFSIQNKSLTIKKESTSNNNNSSSNNNNINIINEMISSNDSIPKRNALIKNEKKKDSFKFHQNTDFSMYKSSLDPKDQKKKKKSINPFLPNYNTKNKKSYSFMGKKNA